MALISAPKSAKSADRIDGAVLMERSWGMAAVLRVGTLGKCALGRGRSRAARMPREITVARRLLNRHFPPAQPAPSGCSTVTLRLDRRVSSLPQIPGSSPGMTGHAIDPSRLSCNRRFKTETGRATMQGQMMHRDLRIIDILTHAAQAHGDQGIVSARVEGDIHRQSYGETLARVARLAHALEGLGVGRGDRIGTLAWNGYRHFELYYAVAGMGAVCHTINPRLSQEQLLYIIRHAGERVLFLDLTFVPLVEALVPDLPQGLRFVVMTDRAHMPETVLDALCYEELLDGQPESHEWPEFPEETASGLCYTSGTTGNPKGALYSHRSTLL